MSIGSGLFRPLGSRPLTAAVTEGVGGLSIASPLSLASTRLIDVVMIGDSNQFLGGAGFDAGFNRALWERVGLYASGVYAQEITGTQYGSQGGNQISAVSGVVNSATTGLPAGFDPYVMPSNFPYCYQATSSMGAQNGLLIQVPTADWYDATNGGLRAHFCYGTWPTGSSKFCPVWRNEASGFTDIVQTGNVNAVTGSYGVAVATRDLPAGARANAVSAKWSNNFGITAPMVEFWHRVENTTRTTGAAISSLYGEGGQSLYDMAAYMQAQTDVALTNYFKAVRYLQVQRGLDPLVVVYINSGMNDRNETSTPSLGPNPTGTPDGAAAYIDNLDAVVNRVKAIWAINGWTDANLHFLVVPAHRISDPDDAELLSYRAACVAWAVGKANTRVVDLNGRMTYAEFNGNSWYDAGGPIHMNVAGYENASRRILAAP